MKRVYGLGLLLMCSVLVLAQDEAAKTPKDSLISVKDGHGVVEPYTTIDAKALNESSGLQYWQGAWWSHNDSGGSPVLYRADAPDFKASRTLGVPGANAIDWEEIAQLGDDLIVCDIGDNYRQRDDLKLYRLAWDTEEAKLKTLATYEVAYADGKHDAEAAFGIEGKLYVVIKHRGEGFHGVYRFDELTEDGPNVAERVATLDLPEQVMITAGDYDRETGKVVLLSYTRVYAYDGAKLEGKPEFSTRIYAAQCEAVCMHENALYYGNEQRDVYRLNGFLEAKYKNALPEAVTASLPLSESEVEPDGLGESWKTEGKDVPLRGLREGEYLRWMIAGPWLMLAGRFEYDGEFISSAVGQRLGSGLMLMFGDERNDFTDGEKFLWLGDNGVTGVDAWSLDTSDFSLSAIDTLKTAGSVQDSKWTFEFAIPLTSVVGEGKLPEKLLANVWGYNLHGEDEPHLAGQTIFALQNPYIWAEVEVD